MTDPTERLIAAWIAWEHTPSAKPACVERIAAIHSGGLNYIASQNRIAAARQAGMSIPDAIQTITNSPPEAPF